MLGYVKIDPAELKGKHHALYRALYCGLCRTAKRLSLWMEPFLSYDFAFLAALRLAFHPDEVKTGKTRCLAHPFRKRTFVLPCRVLEEVAALEWLLTVEKMEDDLSDRDSSVFRRLAERPALFFLRRVSKKIARRDPGFPELEKKARAILREGRELEKNGADLDAMCSNFAGLLSLAFSWGTTGEESRILSRIGDMAGRWIYTVDALDDLEKDRKKGAFNPLLNAGDDKSTYRQVLLYYCDEMLFALQVADLDPDAAALCENICAFGLHHEIDRVLDRKKGVKE